MAEESQDGQEKTEEPTQRQIDKAREEGRVLSSKEMFVFSTLAMGLLLLAFAGDLFALGLHSWREFFHLDSAAQFDGLLLARVIIILRLVIFAALVVGVPMMVVTLLTQIAVGGLNFAPKAMNFKGSRINPLAGLKRMFSVKGLVELAKSVLKVGFLFAIAAVVIWYYLPSIIWLSSSTLNQALGRMAELLPLLVAALLVVLAGIALLDYLWQKHVYMKSLRMTRQQLKDEFKQTEGSPEVKAKIRRMQMEQSQNSARQREALGDVATATAVITNPTHFAVALRYEAGSAGAPLVVAAGRGAIAQQIIALADDHKITVFRAPLLARALYFTCDIGQEISEQLYNAVAVALAYIHRINRGEVLDEPAIELPDELIFDESGRNLREQA